MNTLTNAYLTKISSGTILALLVLSGLVFLIPLATPVNAVQNSSAPTLTATPNAVVGTTATAFSVTVSNPSTNAYAISAITVSAPTGWTFAISATACAGAGSGPFLTTTGASAAGAFQCTGTVSTLLPPGFGTVIGGTITLSGPASPATSPAVTGTFTSSLIDAGSSPAAYAGPSFTETSVFSGAVTVATTPAGVTTFVAGSSALTVTATATSLQQGVPIVLSFTSAYPSSTSFTSTLSPSSGTTSAAGTFTATWTPSNFAGDATTVTAKIGTSASSGATPNSVATVAGSPAKLAFFLPSSPTAFPTTHYLTTSVLIGTVTYANQLAAAASYSIADAFANPIAATSFTGLGGTLLASNGFFSGVTTTATCAIVTTCAYGTIPQYSQSSVFGTVGAIAATVTATTYIPTGLAISLSATSGFIKTSTFMAAPSPTPTIDGSSLVGLTIPAGKTFRVRTIVSPVQSGVPLTLYALPSVATATQTGTFSNGAKAVSLVTNSSGIAASVFTADTLASDAVKFISNATAPTDTTPAATLTASGFSTIITTVPGAASTFVVTACYLSFVGSCPAASLVKSSTTAGTTYYLNVLLSDAYNNAVTSTSASQIQIALTVSPAAAGVLSATSVYITTGSSSTATSFGPITLTIPSTTAVGTSITLTASGAVAGVAVTGAKTVTTISPLPTLAITSPKATGGALFSKTQTVIFTGQANASLGFPSTTLITRVGFKINTAPWQTAAIASANKLVWSVAATFPVGLNTVQFNATDGTNTVVGTSTSVLVDTSAPTITFTTTAGATLTTGSVAATITDTAGDLDPTTVTANYNGTSIPTSSITVTGTNTLGSSVTYTVTVAGLPTGKWKVTVNAKDLAGNAATAASITVTITILTNGTFTATGVAQSTQSGFTGVTATYANNAASSQTVNVWFVAYNAKNQVVQAGFTQLTFATGASATLFQSLTTLPSGTYTVQVFVVSTAGVALSLSSSATVTL